MADKAGPSTPSGPVAAPASQDPPGAVIPPFVCVLPCTAPSVKYIDRLDGCARGLHVTLEDTKDLQASLYGTMAGAIMASEDQPFVGATTPDPCALCQAPIVPRVIFPLLYLENCPHYFHYGCLAGKRDGQSGLMTCPLCWVVSSRALLWPEQFPTVAAKNETFQLQKHSLGLYVAPQTVLKVRECSHTWGWPNFRLTINSKFLLVSNTSRGPLEHQRMPTELWLREPSGAGHVEFCNRKNLLSRMRCPSDRLENGGPNGGGGQRCPYLRECNLWHSPVTAATDPSDLTAPSAPTAPVKALRDFPQFFCVRNSSLFTGGRPACSERVRVHPEELVRCLAGFHPPLNQDLENLDGFACKMAKRIMAPVVVLPEPESPLTCALCHKTAEQPNSAWMYLQNCVHCLHVACLPQARAGHTNPNPNRRLDLHCPTCQVPSVRTLVWPGAFPSELAKQTIFDLQLAQFELCVEPDIALVIVEVPNQVNVFTLDYGGPSLITIDAGAVQDDSCIMYK